jgi:hypothetical protein
MPPRPAARIVVPEEPQMTNGCPQAEAIREQTQAIREQSLEIRRLRLTVQSGIRQMQPACTAVRGLCAVAKKWGPWMLASAPGVLLAIGAISPNAAKALASLLAGAA